MANANQQAPGLYFEVARQLTEIETLRTDIAGFIGGTARGPVGKLTRVQGWREYVERFGAETLNYDTAYAVRGYFENGGQIAYLVRTLGAPFQEATALWQLGTLDAITRQWSAAGPAAGGFIAAEYTVSASSPGVWGNGMRVSLEYFLRGRNGEPQLDIRVATASGVVEQLRGLSPGKLEQQVAERSRLIRLTADPAQMPAASAHQGPLHLSWGPLELQLGNEQPADLNQYLSDLRLLLEEPEVALLVLPDMYRLPGPADAPYRLLARAVIEADGNLDRQVIAAPPQLTTELPALRQWSVARRQQLSGHSARSVAVYQPWLDVKDPLGGIISPLRRVPPVGHVAGVISRLDRARGAHHTPANALIYDAVDAGRIYDGLAQADLVNNGFNPLRCRPGRGLQIWGGRTLAEKEADPEGLYLAHRRLIHRLVRAIRRVAVPLVFDNNGPKLWLTLVRAITTVLLAAYRAGALKGERPEQAFRVTCDDSNNPQATQELGQVHCDIKLAPAVPMEYITLRIALSREGRIEVINP